MNAIAKLKPASTLESLTLALVLAKDEERTLIERRRAIEDQIAEMLPTDALEGSISCVIGDYRIAVKRGLTRSVNSDKLRDLWDTLPTKAQEAFRWSAAVALPKLRALQEYMPAEHAKLAAAVIETKPARPAVTVDLIERAA